MEQALSQIIGQLLSWGPGGALSAALIYLLLKEREKNEVLSLRVHELQEKRVSESREDTARMTAALTTSSDAMEAQNANITNLTRVVELSANRGGTR